MSDVNNELFFITSNEHKFREVSQILKAYNVNIKWYKVKYTEIQADQIEEIALQSAKLLATRLNFDFFLEDTGLFIDVLNGFPGPFSAYVYRTIGNNGILRLLQHVENRNAYFKTCVAYYNSREKTIHTFVGVMEGRISYKIRGEQWGFDPIFIPKGYKKTYAEMGSEKNKISHRTKAIEKFALWYVKNIKKT
ncbi:MAG: XTP/dITP diphosphatase [Candidatus Asgardarchaeia archaeon]